MTAEMIRASATKEKIIESAHRLFSKFGFDGTSVRDIANDCDVNVAAINYHFDNKENLYWEIINASYLRGEEICKSVSIQSTDLNEFVMGVYDAFRENSDLIRNTMKLILTERLTPPDKSLLCFNEENFGPPGGKYLAQFLIKEIPYQLKPEGVFWGVKSIFGMIVHWTTICSTQHFAGISKKQPLFQPKQIRKDIALMAQSTVEFMKRHKEHFGK